MTKVFEKIIYILFILTTGSGQAFAQLSDVDFHKSDYLIDQSGQISYTFIDTIAGVSKEKLYSTHLEWIALNIKDANASIKLQDNNTGKIIVKGNILQHVSAGYKVSGRDIPISYNLHFTLNITIKENKYRLVFEDLIYSGNSHTLLPHLGSSNISLGYILAQIPDTYSFSTLPRKTQREISVNKQIVINSKTTTRSISENIKAFVIKNTASKKDDF